MKLDYRFSPHLALRADYRSLLFKYPNFGGAVGRAITLSSQLALSLVYQPGRKHYDLPTKRERGLLLPTVELEKPFANESS